MRQTMTEGTRTDGHVGCRGTAVVNGPEDDDLDWLSIHWSGLKPKYCRTARQRFLNSRSEPGEPGYSASRYMSGKVCNTLDHH
jgi:hypothetical protein